jgi:Protein of unknown function (DUF2735)
MTENSHRLTAKIYQFPMGGRSGIPARRETYKPAAEVIPEVSARVAIGGSWYHEEAVREADNARKH